MTALTMCLLLGMTVAVNCDITSSELKHLHYTQVKSTEWVTCPHQCMTIFLPNPYPIDYSRVRVTLTDGRQFLIRGAQLADRWQQVKNNMNYFRVTVGDLVKAGLEKYDPVWTTEQCKCISAEDMKNLKKTDAIISKCNF